MKHNFIENNIIIISKQTLDLLLKKKNPADLIALYSFYYYTAKWQKTNSVHCTTSYVQNAFAWSKSRVISSKKELIKSGLIEDIKRKNKKGQITGWYIKINYLWKKETIKTQRVGEPEGGFNHRVVLPTTNAYSANNRNAYNANNKLLANSSNSFASNKINQVFDIFYKNNPSLKWGNKTQRNAIAYFLEKFGLKKTIKLANAAIACQNEQYAPVITTPYELKEKFNKLLIFYGRQKGNNNNYIKL